MTSEKIPAETDHQAFTRWIAMLRADVAESVGGVMLRGARPVPIGTSQGATKVVTSSPGALVGFAVTNDSTDTPASVQLRDGTSTDAAVLITVPLAPGESARDWYGPGGINLGNGLHVTTTGAVSGCMFLRGAE